MTTKKMKSEMHSHLTNNILRFWLDRMIDNDNGGFYGRIDGNDNVVADAEKGAILNARILWYRSCNWYALSRDFLQKIWR